MRPNDMTKGALFCLGILVVMAIAGTCDYQDAVYFRNIEENGFDIEKKDTVESAYDVMRYVQMIDKKKPQ